MIVDPNAAVALALTEARLRESAVAARIRQALMRPHEAPRILTDALETIEHGIHAGDLTPRRQKPQRRPPPTKGQPP